MKRGVRMAAVDAAGLPNFAGSRRNPLRVCPMPDCGTEEPPKGGCGWKWLAIHFAEHLGFKWTSTGWATIPGEAASSTTTRSDER